MSKKVSSGLLAASLLALSHAPVYASEEAVLALEEVLVTARKREESMQDVSVAVSAVTAAAITDAHISNSADITKLVPSLTVSGSGNSQSFAIRGIGTQAFSSGVEPSVATMIDGVVLGRSQQSFMQLVDIERVEVLRGPQGSLFGKNSSAGVVHFITKGTSDEFEAEVSTTVIEEGEYRASGSISAPITDNLGFRLTYGGIRDDGFIENVYDGKTYGGGDSDTFRGKLHWTPTVDLEVQWISDFSSADDGNNLQTQRIVNDQTVADILGTVAASEENYQVNVEGDIAQSIEGEGHSLEVNWDLGDYTLTSISAYRKYEKSSQSDVDARPDNPADFDQWSSDQQTQVSQEVRLASPSGESIHFVAGLYGFQQSNDRQFTREVVGTTGVADFTVDTTNYAAFGEVTFELADNLRAIAGGRYTYDKLEFDFIRNSTFPASVGPVSDATDDTDFSMKGVLEWDVDEQSMAYFSYAEGYKGQAFNVTYGTTPPLDPVKAELSTTFEVGFKSTLLNERLRLNSAIFRTEYEDFQGQQFIDEGGDSNYQLTNAGNVSTQGVEVEFTALLSENLTLFGGVSVIDAVIDDFKGGPCSTGQAARGECPLGLQDLSGKELPFSPDWKINLNANYQLPLETMPFDLVAKLAYQGQGEAVMDISQDRYTVQGTYNTFDLALSLKGKQGNWDVTAFLKNLTDKHYASSIVSQISLFSLEGYTQGFSKNSRRTAGAELKYRF